MIQWTKKSEKMKKELKKGDKKIKRTFLWWPFLNIDGKYYWLSLVTMEYTYDLIYDYIPPFMPTTYLGWVKTKIINTKI